MNIIGFISVGVLLVSPIWFISSKNVWCSSSFARCLKWGSILSLAFYLVGFLIDWLRPFPNTNLDNHASTIMMIAVGLLLSTWVSVIGHRNLLHTEPVTTKRLRLVIDEAKASPCICRFGAHFDARHADASKKKAK